MPSPTQQAPAQLCATLQEMFTPTSTDRICLCKAIWEHTDMSVVPTVQTHYRLSTAAVLGHLQSDFTLQHVQAGIQ